MFSAGAWLVTILEQIILDVYKANQKIITKAESTRL